MAQVCLSRSSSAVELLPTMTRFTQMPFGMENWMKQGISNLSKGFSAAIRAIRAIQSVNLNTYIRTLKWAVYWSCPIEHERINGTNVNFKILERQTVSKPEQGQSLYNFAMQLNTYPSVTFHKTSHSTNGKRFQLT